MGLPTGDIKLSNNFELNAALPLDARTSVVTIANRDAISFKYVGLTVFVSETNLLYVCINQIGAGTWIPVGGPISPLTTQGDLYTHSGGVNARFPIGSLNQVLTIGSGSILVYKTLDTSHIAEDSNFLYYTDPRSDARINLQKGVANGIAPLDGSNRVPLIHMPDALVGAVIYQGTWNSNTNAPALTSSTGTKGHYYYVNVATATATLDGITTWGVGDFAIYNGTIWQKIPGQSASVVSFNTRTGPVTLLLTDVLNAMGTQNANKVFAGPVSGTDATPTFRTMVVNDLPSIPVAKLATTGTPDTTNYLRGDGVWASVSTTFTADVTVVSDGTWKAGKYGNGQTIPLVGKTPQQAFEDMFRQYVSPGWNSFNVSQATQVEVGTTISGSRTFTWSISANSGVVPTIGIFDVTANVSLATTTNDGNEALTATTIQLNSAFAQQKWRGIGNNTSPNGTFNSGDYTVTAYFLLFQGAVTTNPTTSAQVRVLAANQFYGGGTTFTLNTGTTLVKFAVAVLLGVTITSVVDLDALNAVITSQYVLTGAVSVLDAGGTARTYNLYVMTQAVPYSSNHRHSVTIS